MKNQPVHQAGIDRATLAAAVIGCLSPFAFGFMTFRPNRLAAGTGVSLWEAAGSPWGLGFTILWLAVLTASLLHLEARSKLLFTAGAANILFLATILFAGEFASRKVGSADTLSRFSPGPGFWILIFLEIVLMANAFSKSREDRRWLLIMTVLSGIGFLSIILSGHLNELSLIKEYLNRRSRFHDELRTHLIIAAASVGTAFVLGVPLGILALRKRFLEKPTFFTLNIVQTIPSLALFGILIPLLAAIAQKSQLLRNAGVQGIGWAPAIIALTLYSLLPIVRNTFIGFSTVDPGTIDAGLGMGMTRFQLMRKVELPIASPIILNGIRVAFVQAVGLTAVAALIGAGGFGVFIFQGLGQAAVDLILLGAIPTIVIAVVADAAWHGLIGLAAPKGLK